MKKVWYLVLAVVFATCLSFGASLALDPFSDNFDRADSDDIGNGWEDTGDEGISVSIVGGEVLIAGMQDVDWERNGISRDLNDPSSVSFDFLADDVFNVHIRVTDTSTSAYLEIYAWPGGPFTHANSLDGGWPGWVAIEGSEMLAGQYNTLGIERVAAGQYQVTNNGVEIIVLDNAGLVSIGTVLLSSDSAVDSVGSLHIDNVVIDGGSDPSAVKPSGKLSAAWGGIKNSF